MDSPILIGYADSIVFPWSPITIKGWLSSDMFWAASYALILYKYFSPISIPVSV